MMFLQVSANLHQLLDIADVKNAFCQSNPMQRAAGQIFVEPCEGIDLEPGALIELLVNVYGLDDAPVAWRRTVVSYLEQNGFVRSLLEPCWWMRYGSQGQILNVMLLEVDDFMIGSCDSTSRAWIRQLLEARFKFGKYRDCLLYTSPSPRDRSLS
eukprot:1733312-Pyramimonas_sp.AAC.1